MEELFKTNIQGFGGDDPVRPTETPEGVNTASFPRTVSYSEISTSD